MKNNRGSIFVNLVAIIGAVLIFVGIAWLIAKNWHQIPNFLKITILIIATAASFISGVLVRAKEHEGAGRALIVLGALLYFLSIFLISQMYHLATTLQHYAWLFFLGWVLILVSSYLLKSPENLVISMILFFPWLILQYISSVMHASITGENGMIIAFVLLFLSTGIILFSSSIFHKSINHKFTNIYRFWTAFYFLLIFYIISFQSLLPLLSEYSFQGGALTIFWIFFVVLAVLCFIFAILFAASRNSISYKEILIFIGVVLLIFILILSTKIGAGLVGQCTPVTCYNYNNAIDCNSAPSSLLCGWSEMEGGTRNGYCRQINCDSFETELTCNTAPEKLDCTWKADNISQTGYCTRAYCYQYDSETACASAPSNLDCSWSNNRCNQNSSLNDPLNPLNTYQICNEFTNNKADCSEQELCAWNAGPYYGIFGLGRGQLPTQIWILWILINFLFIGFIILVLAYAQMTGSRKMINLGLIFFILEIISRYIGFWLNFRGYLAFSILAILGGIILILGSIYIPKWRKRLINDAPSIEQQNTPKNEKRTN
ncbi:MAG: DUF2157 domain-containing protein [archaeon]